jgi:hypothetical protein
MKEHTNNTPNFISVYNLFLATPEIVTISFLIFTVAELSANGSISAVVL